MVNCNPVYFIVALLLYPVVLLGIVECAARVWVWCRNHEGWNKCCTSGFVSGFAAVVLVCVLAQGIPHFLDTGWDFVEAAAWVVVVYLGGKRVYAHRRLLKRLWRDRFNPNRKK